MPSYYDDNYGYWSGTEDDEMRLFYKKVQQESVWKECSICGRKVRLRPEYDKCNLCCEKIEQGIDIG